MNRLRSPVGLVMDCPSRAGRASRGYALEMGICPNCGAENAEGTQFCGACATPLPSEPGAYIATRKTVTAVFTDVVGSTRLAESIDPESWGKVMSRFFHEIAVPIERHQGMLEKFVGDAVKATFGVPLAHEDDALRAVRAAIEMREALARLNKELETRWGVRLETRTGINTGVVAGTVTAGQSLVVGDAMNVAARLEQAADPGEILIGPDTYRLVSHAIDAEPLEPLALKGKGESVLAYRLLSVDPTAGALVRHFDRPMIGRELERRRVLDSFNRVVTANCCELVTVVGSPGIGKSRFVSALAAQLRVHAAVMETRCLSYGEQISLRPLIDVMKQAAGIGAEDNTADVQTRINMLVEGEENSRAIAQGIADLLGIAESIGGPKEAVWAARKLLETLSRERPLCLVFEDIHWARPALLEFIEHMADWSRDAPILLLCTSRHDLLEDIPTWSRRPIVMLKALEPAECARLVQNLQESEVAESTLGRIMEVTGGNPLFIEQTFSMLRELDVTKRRESSQPISLSDLSPVTVPPSIQALLVARLDRLSLIERQVIECASVVGDEFSSRTVERLLGERVAPELKASLKSLVHKELLRPERWDAPEAETLRFGHALIREAVYEVTPKESRAILHEGVADLLGQKDHRGLDEYDEMIGYHLERAFQYRAQLGPLNEAATTLGERAATCLAGAGRKALARHDGLAARDLLTRASALPQSDDRTRVEFLLDQADAQMVGSHATASDGRKARAVLVEAIAGARSLNDEVLEMQGLVLDCFARFVSDEIEAADVAVKRAESAMGVFERLGDVDGLGRTWNLLAYTNLEQGQMVRVHEAAERAIEYSRQCGNAREEAWARRYLVFSLLYGPEPVERAINRATKELEWARSNGHRVMELNILFGLGYLHAMRGAFADGRGFISASRTIANDLGMPTEDAWAACFAARLEMLASMPQAAEEELHYAYGIYEGAGDDSALSTISAALADALYAGGRYDEADKYASISERYASPSDSHNQSRWRRVRAKLLARGGETRQAEMLGREGLDLLMLTDFVNRQANALMDLAEVFRDVKRPTDVDAAFRKALKLYEQKGNVVAADRARTLLAV